MHPDPTVAHIRTSHGTCGQMLSTFVISNCPPAYPELLSLATTKGVVVSTAPHNKTVVSVCDWTGILTLCKLYPNLDPKKSLPLLLRESFLSRDKSGDFFLTPGIWHVPLVTPEDGEKVFADISEARRRLGLSNELTETLFFQRLQTLSAQRISAGGLYMGTLDAEIAAGMKLLNNLVENGAAYAHIAQPDEYAENYQGWKEKHLHGQTEGWINLRRTIILDLIEAASAEERGQDDNEAA